MKSCIYLLCSPRFATNKEGGYLIRPLFSVDEFSTWQMLLRQEIPDWPLRRVIERLLRAVHWA